MPDDPRRSVSLHSPFLQLRLDPSIHSTIYFAYLNQHVGLCQHFPLDSHKPQLPFSTICQTRHQSALFLIHQRSRTAGVVQQIGVLFLLSGVVFGRTRTQIVVYRHCFSIFHFSWLFHLHVVLCSERNLSVFHLPDVIPSHRHPMLTQMLPLLSMLLPPKLVESKPLIVMLLTFPSTVLESTYRRFPFSHASKTFVIFFWCQSISSRDAHEWKSYINSNGRRDTTSMRG